MKVLILGLLVCLGSGCLARMLRGVGDPAVVSVEVRSGRPWGTNEMKVRRVKITTTIWW